MRAEDSLRVLRDRLLHPQRRVARSHGVVLMRQRRAEERHDPVAHHLVHGALVAVHGLHHPFEHGIEQLAGLLRVAIGEQLHRALQVGEEDGHLFTFAFERGLRRENLFGKVLWRVGFRGNETGRPWTGCWSSHKGSSTAVAELTSGLKLGTTARTDSTECRPALSAESCPFALVRLAPWTLHAAGSPIGEPDRFAARYEWANLSRRLSGGQGSSIRRGTQQQVH